MASEPSSPRSRPAEAAESGLFATLGKLWAYMWPPGRTDLKLRVVFAFAMLIGSKVVTTLVPFAYKGIIDQLAHSAENPSVVLGIAVPIVLVIAYGLGNVLDSAFQQLRDVSFAAVGQHAVRTLANRTFAHVHRLSLRFHLARRTGGLSRAIERGINGIETVVRFAMLNTIPTVIEFAIVGGIFIVMFGTGYLSVLAAMVALYLWFTIKTSNWRIGIRRAMNESDTDANSKAVDSLLNFETVKYFNNEALEQRRYDAAMARYERAAIRIWQSLGLLNFGQAFIFYAGLVVIGTMTVNGVLAGRLTVGDFVLLVSFLMQVYRPLNQMGFVYRELRQALTDIEEMFKLLGEKPEIVDATDARPLTVTGPVVRFENVHFHYDPDRPILKGVDFTIPAGHTVAVVGPSGAGKSTISRLLFHFYDVTGGRITIDGQDIRAVTQDSLRARIGMVPQDTVLFNDTIAYNILYGRPDASEAEMRRAAEMAQIADFVKSLPQGYETQVGERGLKLSGGEKQRVAIARTILKAPAILILDEATSALDTKTERDIQAALDAISTDRTTLVIAHRLSTVVNADEILVLSGGRIVERGRHGALLARGGLYAEMWNRQREADEAEEQLRRTGEAGFVRRDVSAAE